MIRSLCYNKDAEKERVENLRTEALIPRMLERMNMTKQVKKVSKTATKKSSPKKGNQVNVIGKMNRETLLTAEQQKTIFSVSDYVVKRALPSLSQKAAWTKAMKSRISHLKKSVKEDDFEVAFLKKQIAFINALSLVLPKFKKEVYADFIDVDKDSKRNLEGDLRAIVQDMNDRKLQIKKLEDVLKVF